MVRRAASDKVECVPSQLYSKSGSCESRFADRTKSVSVANCGGGALGEGARCVEVWAPVLVVTSIAGANGDRFPQISKAPRRRWAGCRQPFHQLGEHARNRLAVRARYPEDVVFAAVVVFGRLLGDANRLL